MALAQEFWMQRRRQAAEAAKKERELQNAMLTGGSSVRQGGPSGPASLVSESGVHGAGTLMGIRENTSPVIPGGATAPYLPVRYPTMLGVEDTKNEWNSDDEDIDEFGRKKRKAKSNSTTARARAAASPGSAPDGDAGGGGSAPSKEAEARGAKKVKGAISEKQQAALERLQKRSKKVEPESEAAPAPAPGAASQPSPETTAQMLAKLSAASSALLPNPQTGVSIGQLYPSGQAGGQLDPQAAFNAQMAPAMAQFLAISQAQAMQAQQAQMQAWASSQGLGSLPGLEAWQAGQAAPGLEGWPMQAQAQASAWPSGVAMPFTGPGHSDAQPQAAGVQSTNTAQLMALWQAQRTGSG